MSKPQSERPSVKVSVIFPALNEVESIEQVLKEIPPGVADEFLVVDGHSTDGTPELVRRLGFRVIEQEGTGYGRAVATGFKHVQGDVVIPVDADGSCSLEDIPRLVARLQEGYDVALGSRYLPESGSKDDTTIRLIGNKSFTFLMNLLFGWGISDSLFFYAAIRRSVFESITVRSRGCEYCVEFIIRAHQAGFRLGEIPSVEKRRIAGVSKVHAVMDGLRVLWVILQTLLRPEPRRQPPGRREMPSNDSNPPPKP